MPNYKSTNNSAATPANFKYGNYCGKGHPTCLSKSGSQQRTQDLFSNWPPVDDIDLMCYAHDICNQLAGRVNLVCDYAMITTSFIHSNNFNKEFGCNNINKLLISCLGLKFWELREDKSISIFSSIVNSVVMLPLVALTRIQDQKRYETYGFSKKEGIWFRNNEKWLQTLILIAEFEAQYQINATETDGFIVERDKSIEIPVPVNNWDKTYTIFKIQKYLNYYGYHAGFADGKFGRNTKNAIKIFQSKISMKPSGVSSKILLQNLSSKYFSRSQKQRIAEMNFTSQKIG